MAPNPNPSKPTQRHLLRLGVTLLVAFAVAPLLVACGSRDGDPVGMSERHLPAGNSGYQEEASVDYASVGLVNDAIPTVHLMGSPREIGRQHGSMLATLISEVLDGYVLPYAESRGGRELFDVGAELLEEHLTDDEREEIRGIAEGSERSVEDILLLNTFLDTAAVLAGREGHSIPLQGAVMGVSNMAMYTDAPVLGGTFETETVGVHSRPQSIVFVYPPEVGKPFITVSYPGMIGCYSGMNLDGVSLFAAAVPGPLGLNPSTPFSILCRRVLARTDTVEVAAEKVLHSDISTSHNLTIADNQERIWQLECSVERIVVRKNARGKTFGKHVFFCSNHFDDEDMECQQAPPTVASLRRVEKLQEARENLRDFYWRPSSVIDAMREASIERNLSASVIFFPDSHTLYVSTAGDPDESKPFHPLTPNLTYGVLRPELAR